MDEVDYYRVWEDDGSLFESCLDENLTMKQAQHLVRIAPAHVKRRAEKQDSFIHPTDR